MSTFGGIEIARRALNAHQTALDVAGHNIANVNTPGYTRQRAHLVATPPDGIADGIYPAVSLRLGTGVDIAAITRVRDLYLDERLVEARGALGESSQLRDILDRAQRVYGEPGSGGISSLLNGFFNSFQELSKNPESGSNRYLVRSQGAALARRFNEVAGALDQLGGELEFRIAGVIQEANTLAREVARLNEVIARSKVTGGQPNDLEDQRDELVRQLGELAGASSSVELDASGRPTGHLQVRVNGFTLVQGSQAFALPAKHQMAGESPALRDGADIFTLRGGRLAGLVRAAGVVQGYRVDLDESAAALISRVNTQHQAGYGLDGVTGRSFFDGAGAGDMRIHADVAASPDAIAAASAPPPGKRVAPGNGDNARAIAGLATARVIGSFTIGEFYAARVARVGEDARSQAEQAGTAERLLQQVDNLRASVSGVSLDEELTHMLETQRAYQAAARVLTAMDALLDHLINDVGR